jgi:hypothetical protein
VEDGEECDDGNDDPLDECDECDWVCNPPNVERGMTGTCYRLGPSFDTWFEGRTYCQAWRPLADLAGLSDEIEVTFLAGTSISPYEYMYIGAYDPNDDNTSWHWVNGEPWGYTAWLTGEPQSTPNEQCSTIATGEWTHWRDSPCMLLGGQPLCEWSP